MKLDIRAIVLSTLVSYLAFWCGGIGLLRFLQPHVVDIGVLRIVGLLFIAALPPLLTGFLVTKFTRMPRPSYDNFYAALLSATLFYFYPLPPMYVLMGFTFVATGGAFADALTYRTHPLASDDEFLEKPKQIGWGSRMLTIACTMYALWLLWKYAFTTHRTADLTAAIGALLTSVGMWRIGVFSLPSDPRWASLMQSVGTLIFLGSLVLGDALTAFARM